MAKQMSVMMFGRHKDMRIEQVPTDYLLWVFGSFPKLRNKLRGVLVGRGLSLEQIEQKCQRHRVLAKSPESSKKRHKKPKWKRLNRTDEQLRANNVARAMGMEVPYPRYQAPAELGYFMHRVKHTRHGGALSNGAAFGGLWVRPRGMYLELFKGLHWPYLDKGIRCTRFRTVFQYLQPEWTAP